MDDIYSSDESVDSYEPEDVIVELSSDDTGDDLSARDESCEIGSDIVSKENLLKFVKAIDPMSSMDDHALDLFAKMADNFVEDVCEKMVKACLNPYQQISKDVLERTLDREYNIKVPKKSSQQSKSKH
ncbi:GL15975 [Drosophila persimilis]|uniref:Transcription initiation factor TFIID subunit 12 n=2 Tax=pseudoobscura subgroup TaxID=32358 RepID=B5DJ72_DROPS|nr:uncharacterized protein LOC6595377 [Drosophila persimilis]XP_002132947.1 uncharacterized protein LOC6903248 [Drosophila pseudoobscura]EDW39806.1 GL15975 [Drosophila persimilis]